MLVYVVVYESRNWEQYHCIEGVFSTEEAAEAYIKKQNPNAQYCYDIKEFEVDEDKKEE